MIAFPTDIAHVLMESLRDRPGQEAIVTRSGSWSYRQLDDAANRAANALLALGVKPGDRIAVSLPQDIEIIAAFHGAMRIGAIWVGIGEGLAPPEKAYILADTGASMLICTPRIATQLEDHRSNLPALTAIVPCGSGAGDADWRKRVDAQPTRAPDAEIDPEAPAAIAYTSGTTGFPKGAVHSQRNMLLPGWYLSMTRGYDHTLRKGDCFPLTILNMLILTTLLTAQTGGTAVIIDSMRSEAIVEWIRRERIQVWNGPPPVLFTLAHDRTVLPSDLASLREVWSGGAECPAAVRKAFESKFERRIFSTYGQTEVPTTIAMEPLGEAHIPGMTGRPLPHFALTIRGEQDEPLATGESGQICVAAQPPAEIRAAFRRDYGIALSEDDEPPIYTPMLGYWQRPQESERTLRGGILHTGDAAILDAKGNLRFADRLSLILNRGGANVYPAEIERVVTALADVEACAVFGVPDERLGQRVAMLVQFTPNAAPRIEPVLEHCRSELAPYKVPELVGVVDAFPRNAMGKIDRRAVSATGSQIVRRVGARA